MQELHRVLNMPQYGWILSEFPITLRKSSEPSEYVSYNTWREVTLQGSEYLLIDGRIQNPVKDLRPGFWKWQVFVYVSVT